MQNKLIIVDTYPIFRQIMNKIEGTNFTLDHCILSKLNIFFLLFKMTKIIIVKPYYDLLTVSIIDLK